jgi:hypothetical protein
MAKYRKASNRGKMRLFLLIIVFVIVLLAGFLVYRYLFCKKTKSYLVENKYYGFKLQTPENWFAEGNTFYSEDNIAQILAQCSKDNSANAYKIGEFIFKDQKYPQDFEQVKKIPANLPSGAIFDVTVSCVPKETKQKIIDYSNGRLKVGEEKAIEEFLNLIGFGKTEYISFLHNDFQYTAIEYVYVSPADKIQSSASLRDSYAQVFNKIISSFKFIK